ncbi:hypothetical protein SCG7109_AG_00150 [Chlamydiales bacterium SCGC AG-110-M15]|nr:hypothetical protein SCG7109_AG_00150 [Chlamydiales bacterium SCGC AG-110-M15]
MSQSLTEDPFSPQGSTFLSGAMEGLFFRSWWLVLFFLLCYISYEHTLESWRVEYAQLEQKMSELKEAKHLALDKQKNLVQEISSQNDHEWIELTLMKGLGVVPEGQTKVFFDQQTAQ